MPRALVRGSQRGEARGGPARSELAFLVGMCVALPLRMRWIWALVVSSVSVSGAAAESSSVPPVAGVQQSEPHPWQARPFAIDGVIGIATPFGLAGVSVEYAPVEALSLGGGLGTNLVGLQLAGMARLRFTPEQRSSLFFGAGYSQGAHYQGHGVQDGVLSLITGPLAQNSHNSHRYLEWSTARWINLEVGGERRNESGFDARGFVGIAILLNADDGVLSERREMYDRSISPRAAMVYAGTALGYAL
jgi:hypothetical protein